MEMQFNTFHSSKANYCLEKDVIIVGGGVAGYVAAIKAGQSGLKVCRGNLRDE
jgi:ribulose 1,5-bisphosphate synthetase/thiazole synthase